MLDASNDNGRWAVSTRPGCACVGGAVTADEVMRGRQSGDSSDQCG